MAFIEVENLTKYFDTPNGMLHAVDGVSFAIDQGKTLGIVGESGCGKSTLGRVILHLLEPTRGKITFDGRDITSLKRSELKAMRRNMQMIFQDPFSSIDPRMTVSQIIEEPMRVHKLYHSEHEYAHRVEEIMDTVGLAPRLRLSYPHELDGGRRQRIGIGRALALDPKFIVCDEPVSALDVSIQAQILNLMQDLQEQHGLTYIFITHDLSVVRHISDDIAVMYLGTLVEKAPAKTLFQRQLHPYTQALISAIPQTDIDHPTERILLKGEITSPIEPPEMCRFYPRCPCGSEICSCRAPEMKEVEPGHFVACHQVMGNLV